MAGVLARLVDHALALRAQEATGFESPASREEQLRGFLNALGGVNLSAPETVALVAVVGPDFPEAVSALQKEQPNRCRLQDFRGAHTTAVREVQAEQTKSLGGKKEKKT